MDNNRRTVLIIIFTFSLAMLFMNWQRQTPLPAEASNSQSVAATGGLPVQSTALSSAATASPVAIPNLATTAPAAAKKPHSVVVTTDLYSLEVSEQGGDIVRMELLAHHSADDRKNNFLLFDPMYSYSAQNGLIGSGYPNHLSRWQFKDINSNAISLTEGSNQIELTMTPVPLLGNSLGDQTNNISKTYVFHRGSYLIDIRYQVGATNANAVPPSAYFQLVRNDKDPPGSNSMVLTFTGPAFYSEEEKFQKISFSDIAKNKAKHILQAKDGWVAMVQHYFVSCFMPPDSLPREFYLHGPKELGGDLYSAGVIVPLTYAKPGEAAQLTVPLYAGPQEQEKLRSIAPGLNLVVDYGWLTIIASPLFWVLEWIHKITGNWGWSIIVLTILIKLIFFPLSAASYKSMARMKTLTPKLLKLKETYSDDRQRLNTEMMALYKREKVNPLGGCLPILVQIPVFIALYWVLLGSVEMRQAPWLGWVQDLSTRDPYFILPLFLGATMLVQAKLNPAPPDPIQAKIMWILPIVFTGMFLMFPAGLVLYWTVNNLLSIAQQWQINRIIEKGETKKA